MPASPWIIVLAALQGVAEFLPISSSGHLVLAAALVQQCTGREVPDFLEVSIVLHAGTLLSIVVFYWQRIWRMLLVDRRVLGLVLVGSLPAAAVGVPLHEIASARTALESPLLAACLLPVTGLILLWGARRTPGDVDYAEMSFGQALWIGVVQAVAILPGISRSGSTIVAGLAVGLRREAAATFSFLLAIPAIGGAALLELIKLVREGGTSLPASELAVGAAVSFVVGLVSLWWLVSWLRRGRLQWVAWWCIPAGLAALAWLLLR